MQTRFEWDSAKARSNLRKHGVSFDDAILVFADPFALMVQDRIEGTQARWQTLGSVGGFLLLLVAHTIGRDDEGTELVRIISARAADRKERKRYEEQSR